MTIGNIRIRKIFDSRGEPTIEVLVENEERQIFEAQIPSGKSTGEKEAVVLDYEKAKKVLEKTVKSQFAGREYGSVQEIDNALLKIDNTPQKKIIGGNVALGISVGAARALAAEKKQQVWELLRKEFFSENKAGAYPLIFSNLINGGAHAENNLDIQEYMVVLPFEKPFADSLETLIAVYEEVGKQIQKSHGISAVAIGDEGGFAADFSSNGEPLEIVNRILQEHQLGTSFLALDAAASSFRKDGGYIFEGKELSSENMSEVYEEYFSKIEKLLSIEDPFGEHEGEMFQALLSKAPDRMVVGDDLTVTNAKIIEKAARQHMINAVIIKPNQVGTITETVEAIQAARKYGLKVIVSHRSGETNDNFIIHLARAAQADGVKIGAPTKERLGKYNELLRVYENL